MEIKLKLPANVTLTFFFFTNLHYGIKNNIYMVFRTEVAVSV